jgi:hypothetical protein
MLANQGQGLSSSQQVSEKPSQSSSKEDVVGKQADSHAEVSSPMKKK